LYTSQKVEHSRFDVDARVRRPKGGKIKIPALEVSGKITLDSEIAREVSRRRDFESVEAFALADDVSKLRIVVADARVDPVVRISSKELKFFVVSLGGGD